MKSDCDKHFTVARSSIGCLEAPRICLVLKLAISIKCSLCYALKTETNNVANIMYISGPRSQMTFLLYPNLPLSYDVRVMSLLAQNDFPH